MTIKVSDFGTSRSGQPSVYDVIPIFTSLLLVFLGEFPPMDHENQDPISISSSSSELNDSDNPSEDDDALGDGELPGEFIIN